MFCCKPYWSCRVAQTLACISISAKFSHIKEKIASSVRTPGTLVSRNTTQVFVGNKKFQFISIGLSTASSHQYLFTCSINFYGFSIRTGNFVSKVTHELRKLKPNDLRKFNKIKYGQMVVIKKNWNRFSYKSDYWTWN